MRSDLHFKEIIWLFPGEETAVGKGEGRKGNHSGSDCISLGAQRHVWVVCIFLPSASLRGLHWAVTQARAGLRDSSWGMCVFPLQHISEFSREAWNSDQDLFPKFQNMKDMLREWASPVELLQWLRAISTLIATIFLPNHPWKINSLLLKKYYFKNFWTLICLMLPCHQWCVSPDALAQDMGRRRLIFLCQASLAVTFVRAAQVTATKHLIVYLELPIMAEQLTPLSAISDLYVSAKNGHETNLEGCRYPN